MYKRVLKAEKTIARGFARKEMRRQAFKGTNQQLGVHLQAGNALSLTIVRHGETRLNAENIVQGHIDEPLNEKGLKQATLLGKFIKNDRPFTHVISSDLIRARQTCENILKECQPDMIGQIKFDQDLRERFYGTGIDGVITVDDYFERFHKSCELEPNKYGKPPDVRLFKPAEDTESLDKIEKRQRRFLINGLMTKPFNANVLVVTHGIFIKEFYQLLDKKKRINSINELERPFPFIARCAENSA